MLKAATKVSCQRRRSVNREQVSAKRRRHDLLGSLRRQRVAVVPTLRSVHPASGSPRPPRSYLGPRLRTPQQPGTVRRGGSPPASHGPARTQPAAVPNRRAGDRKIALRAEPDTARAVTAGLLPRLGLITAELITNALKHGAGPVLVELRLGEGGGVVVAVSDQGPGFPASFNPAACKGSSLGMRLLVSLARPGRVWVDPADRRRILVQLKDRAPSSI